MTLRNPPIPICAYYPNDQLPVNHPQKALALGCSGGSGHNLAVMTLVKYIAESQKLDISYLPSHLPQLPKEKISNTLLKSQLNIGVNLTYNVPGLQTLLKRSESFPVLPDANDIKTEVTKLIQSQLDSHHNKVPRYYVDMLLDVQPMGYESAAIWNILYQKGAKRDLAKIIKLQPKSDSHNHKYVYDYFIQKLEEAAENNCPYTEIISTQAMSLATLCEAAQHYNDVIVKKYPHVFPLKIHQYMTDTPTANAIHFFNPLKQLTDSQCQQLYLYACGLHRDLLVQLQLINKPFAGLFNLNPLENPLVRPAFRGRQLDDLLYLKKTTLAVNVTDSPDEFFPVDENEKIAVIMLGSQASQDTLHYTKELYNSSYYKKIFVFGGKKPHLEKPLNDILNESEHRETTIIPLDYQDDYHMSALMIRSDLLIIGAGGMTIMEQKSLLHDPKQVILVHSSGIIWEDGNTNEFIDYMWRLGIMVKKTSTPLIAAQLKQIKTNTFFLSNLSSVSESATDTVPIPEKISYFSKLVCFWKALHTKPDQPTSKSKESTCHSFSPNVDRPT